MISKKEPYDIVLSLIYFFCIHLITVNTLIANSALNPPKPIDELSLLELEGRLDEIDQELDQLARHTLRSGVGSAGYRSLRHKTPNATEHVTLHFDATYPLREIVMIPNILRDPVKGFQSDAFPSEFRLIGGTDDDNEGTEIAKYSLSNDKLPRIAPFIIPANGFHASWIRLEATKLSCRAYNQFYVLQLAEIMVFSGSDNIALHQEVEVNARPNNTFVGMDGWDKQYLVDGALPYFMDSSKGSQSVAYVTPPLSNLLTGETLPCITIDLENSYPLDTIHLHTVEQRHTVPQVHASNFAVPHHLKVLGANKADFSDVFELIDYQPLTIQETKPIMSWRIPPTHCRYIRLVAENSKGISNDEWKKTRIGFAEVECISKGTNVALGATVTTNFRSTKYYSKPKLNTLTDGKNLYGSILPQHQWITELSKRHKLERERPIVESAIKQYYVMQKKSLWLVSWLAIFLAAGIAITILTTKISQQRQFSQIKERFTADLHDELGANVHTIGILSDAAQASHGDAVNWQSLHTRIRELTERSGKAIRYCINMLDSKGLYFGLAEDIRRLANRKTGEFQHNIIIEGEEYLDRLHPRKRIDIFLFYKECLINIWRHSEASSITTKLIAKPNEICLIVQDNGKGLSKLTDDRIPASLKRRANLLKAKIQVTTAPNKGLFITLNLKIKRFGWIR